MNCADRVAEWLEQKDIRHAFGIIGGGSVVLWDAISRRGFTELFCVHHEQAAVMAAAYYYRTSDRVALALLTTGAGSSNGYTGLLAAHFDSIPVLVLSGNEHSKYVGRPERVWGTQGFDSSGVASGMSKGGFRAGALDVLTLLDGALRLALEPRQGPVWVDIPKDVQQSV